MNKSFQTLVFFVVGFVLLCTGCKPVEEKTVNNEKKIETQCITSQSHCVLGDDEVSFTVKFAQQDLGSRIKTELPVFIELSNFSSTASKNDDTEVVPDKISAYLEGRDMFMGKVPVFFKQESHATQPTENNTYLAETSIASCMEEEMVWRLWITLEIKGKSETFFVDITTLSL